MGFFGNIKHLQQKKVYISQKNNVQYIRVNLKFGIINGCSFHLESLIYTNWCKK
jgi:hypothetical protein